jgi:hypothetical protein
VDDKTDEEKKAESKKWKCNLFNINLIIRDPIKNEYCLSSQKDEASYLEI